MEWAGRRTKRQGIRTAPPRSSGLKALVIVATALLALATAASPASACSCVRQHAAMFLPHAEAAVVGVVESRDGIAHVVRVERAVKGTSGERVVVESGLTSCQVRFEPGTRVGLFLTRGASGGWTTNACAVADPDALLAAAELPAPRGAGRFVAAVDAPALGAVALTAGGRAAGYAVRDGRPLALAACGSGVVQAVRAGDGRVRLGTQQLPQLLGAGATEIGLDDVFAVGCTGRTLWAAGPGGLVSVRDGVARRVLRRPASAAAIVRGTAYLASEGVVRAVRLSDRRTRTVRHAGRFATLSARGNRVAGRLRDGRAAVLDLRSGRLRKGGASDAVWLGGDRLLAGRSIVDARLRVVHRLTGPLGRVVGVEGGVAYLADGRVLRRLESGAKRARAFATLPGEIVALTRSSGTARASWHSRCQSAKNPLTI